MSLVIFKNKDEKTRIVIDYRKLIEITVTNAKSISSADEFISLMSPSSSIFSKFDMTTGYYQIPMAPESKHLTFSTPFGLCEFKYMPFGLVNVLSTFLRMPSALLC